MIDKKSGGILQTHWDECWREPTHHACTLGRVERLEQKVEGKKKKIRRQAEEITKLLKGKQERKKLLQERYKQVQQERERRKEAEAGLATLEKTYWSACDEIDGVAGLWHKCEAELAECRLDCDTLDAAVDALIEERGWFEKELAAAQAQVKLAKGVLSRIPPDSPIHGKDMGLLHKSDHAALDAALEQARAEERERIARALEGSDDYKK